MTAKIPPVPMGSGNTVYECPTCGLQAWGAGTFYHEWRGCGAHMEPIGYYRFNRWTNAWTWMPKTAPATSRIVNEEGAARV